MQMIHSTGYSAGTFNSKLKPLKFERQEPRSNEVQIAIQFGGVCHSDLHQARNEWGNTVTLVFQVMKLWTLN